MKDSIYNFICKGFIVNYTQALEEDASKKNKSFLEYAIVYGRYNILFHMLKDDFYINLLKDEDYNPLDFSCAIDITRDIYENSYWGNDEPERAIINRKNIKHRECFDLLKTFNKKLTKNTFEKWYSLYMNFQYYSGSYFPTVDFLINELYEEKPTMHEFIEDFENLLSEKKMVKIIFQIYSPIEIINKLKNYLSPF